jgi:hypothetical protein
MQRSSLCFGFTFCALLLASGCGDEGGAPGGTGGTGGFGVELPTAESYYPEKMGNSWTYVVTPLVDLPSYKVVTIDAMEMVGGTGTSKDRPAFRHITCKSAPSPEACAMAPSMNNKVDRTVGWLGMADKVLGNYREQAFKKATDTLVEEDWWEPFRNKVDMSPEHTKLGVTWVDMYKEWKRPVNGITISTQQMETWTVVAVDETVTVNPPPAIGGTPRVYPHCLQVSHTTSGGAMAKTFWYAKGIGKVKETGGQTEELLDYKVAP